MRGMKARVRRLEQQHGQWFGDVDVMDKEFQKILDSHSPEEWNRLFEDARQTQIVLGNWDLVEQFVPADERLLRPVDELYDLILAARGEEALACLDEE